MWTKSKKMILNKKKTKNMIFNFTKNYQFTTRMVEDNVNIEVFPQIKLLGTLITSDLKWDINTQHLLNRAYGRRQLLDKAVGPPVIYGFVDLKPFAEMNIRKQML